MKLQNIIDWLKATGYKFEFKGEGETIINGFSSLEKCEKNKITWIKKAANYENISENVDIECAVVQSGLNVDIPNQIISASSKELFFAILRHYWGQDIRRGEVGQGTYISPEADIDATVTIGSNCSIIGRIRIGANTVIENNVSISNQVEIGAECVIHSGVVIGKDGFGFAFDDNNIPMKVPHFGGVLIGDRVEIGANSVVDRGTLDNTVIGDDVKIDSLVIVAHNAEVGAGTLIVGGVTIGGSCKIGEKSYIAPQAIIKNQIDVGSDSFVGMGETLSESLNDNSIYINGKQNSNKNYRRFL